MLVAIQLLCLPVNHHSCRFLSHKLAVRSFAVRTRLNMRPRRTVSGPRLHNHRLVSPQLAFTCVLSSLSSKTILKQSNLDILNQALFKFTARTRVQSYLAVHLLALWIHHFGTSSGPCSRRRRARGDCSLSGYCILGIVLYRIISQVDSVESGTTSQYSWIP